MYKDFVKSMLIYGLAGSIGKFIGFFLMPIYVRIFPPEQYGIIDLVQTLITIISILGTLLLESSIQRYYYEAKSESMRKEYISSAFWTIFMMSVFWMLAVGAFSKVISKILFQTRNTFFP